MVHKPQCEIQKLVAKMKYLRLHKCRLPQDEPCDLSIETRSITGYGTSIGSKQSGDDIGKVKGFVKAMERVIKTREPRQPPQETSRVGENGGGAAPGKVDV